MCCTQQVTAMGMVVTSFFNALDLAERAERGCEDFLSR